MGTGVFFVVAVCAVCYLMLHTIPSVEASVYVFNNDSYCALLQVGPNQAQPGDVIQLATGIYSR